MKLGRMLMLCRIRLSLPLRECGLKSRINPLIKQMSLVTPLAGVWIEISEDFENAIAGVVTPLAGVWIEIIY